jgi:molecular chaperone GrpE
MNKEANAATDNGTETAKQGAANEKGTAQNQQQHTEKPRLKRRSSIVRLKEKMQQLKEKNEELIDKYRRLYADFDNFKKRSAKEWIEKNKEAGRDVIMELLPVIDDFERALKNTQKAESVEAVREGEELIYNKLKKTLVQRGLEPMVSIGQPFDPDSHDAITEIPAPKEADKGKVLDEIEKGYLLNGRIIRHAKVVVGK